MGEERTALAGSGQSSREARDTARAREVRPESLQQFRMPGLFCTLVQVRSGWVLYLENISCQSKHLTPNNLTGNYIRENFTISVHSEELTGTVLFSLSL